MYGPWLFLLFFLCHLMRMWVFTPFRKNRQVSISVAELGYMCSLKANKQKLEIPTSEISGTLSSRFGILYSPWEEGKSESHIYTKPKKKKNAVKLKYCKSHNVQRFHILYASAWHSFTLDSSEMTLPLTFKIKFYFRVFLAWCHHSSRPHWRA